MTEDGSSISSAAEYERAFWRAVKDDNWSAAEMALQAYAFVWPKEGSQFRSRVEAAVDMVIGET